MQEPVLVILAAGMGSRYGGLKQIETVGSNGESIIDFSIYDAIEAGFKKLILIIREEHEEAFEKALVSNIRPFIDVQYAYQALSDIPPSFSVPEGREKPWGTTQALLAIRHQIDAPFMIINADDYYGKRSYKIMYDFLSQQVSDQNFAMMGYVLENTLTDHGTVTRAIGEIEGDCLTKIVEIKKIAKKEGEVKYTDDDVVWHSLNPNSLVSMNYWGFTPAVIPYFTEIFEKFLADNLADNPLKCEHVLPTAVGDLINNTSINVCVLETDDEWFGVTYREDKDYVVQRLQDYKDNGDYPYNLWEQQIIRIRLY